MSSNGTQFRNLAPINFEMRAISYFSLITQALTLAVRCIRVPPMNLIGSIRVHDIVRANKSIPKNVAKSYSTTLINLR